MVDVTTLVITFLTVFFLWLTQAVYQILTWTYWWQVKEYRFDRFWTFLRSEDGREKLGLLGISLKFLSLIFLGFYPPVSIFIFICLDLVFLKNILAKRTRKPVVTQRIERIWATSIFGLLITFISFYFFFFKALILGEILLILTPYLGILWTIPIVNKVKRREIEKARKVLDSVRPVVVGITGSYGKTTTKDYIAHLLAQKYKVAKTEGSENTEFGIARKTVKNVKSRTKFFVVEMGAYKIGEIEKLASIVHPEVGIITGIEEQHLSLFGSLGNIMIAKFELIASLPKDGIAVFNLSNNYVQALREKVKKLAKNLKIYGYYMVKGKDEVKSADFRSRVVNVDINGITFEVTDGKERRKFTTTLHGIHFIENLTGAILVARILGVSWREIERGVSSLTNAEHTMGVYELINGNIIIDDSYNSTPKGFVAALNYLDLYKDKRKVVVTPGVIELGILSSKIHRKLGNLMVGVVDKLYLLSSEPFKEIKKISGLRTSVKLVKEPEKLIKELESLDKSVILLEGRQPGKLINYLEAVSKPRQ